MCDASSCQELSKRERGTVLTVLGRKDDEGKIVPFSLLGATRKTMALFPDDVSLAKIRKINWQLYISTPQIVVRPKEAIKAMNTIIELRRPQLLKRGKACEGEPEVFRQRPDLP